MSKLIRRVVPAVLVGGVVAGGYYGYQENTLNILGTIQHEELKQRVKVSNEKINLSDRQAIVNRMMKETHRAEGLHKQGFVSMPSLGILQPIFDNAYSEVGLDAGANYANRTADDPDGKQVPVMGQGNYGLASHNFNDGKTGFSALQERLNQDAPYLVDGELKGSDWLNGQPIYMANRSGIYEYKVTNQILVNKGDTNVLRQTQSPQLTIISCLFPSTQYRIITKASLDKLWDGTMHQIRSFTILT
ncbi:class A sortase [Weissella confusa]|uniref:class A sortase n=1 Tax=Weissella confusa TaxID=1583 RepID=UPI001F3A8852|nr:class A sortase [Weissella confusa]